MTTPHKDLPKILNSQKVFDGRVFKVTVDTVSEGELTYQRDVVHHPGSAVIVPVHDDGTVVFVKQYRHPAVRYLLELPAGTLAEASVPKPAPHASSKRSSDSWPRGSISSRSSLCRQDFLKRRCGCIWQPGFQRVSHILTRMKCSKLSVCRSAMHLRCHEWRDSGCEDNHRVNTCRTTRRIAAVGHNPAV